MYLAHPGQNRMELTLRRTFTWENLRADVLHTVRNCRECQLCKKSRRKYGQLPVKTAEKSEPWNRDDVEMI